MNHFIRITTTRKDTSRTVEVERDRSPGPGASRWPIDLFVAGVSLSMTDAGARELIEKLQRATEAQS